MKLTARQRWLWLRAILSAVFHSIGTLIWRDYLSNARKVFNALFTTPEDEVSDELFNARMSACRGCEVFRSNLVRCGFVNVNGVTLGCGCYLEVKNRLKSSRCWIRENTDIIGLGWPDELMPLKQ